MKTLAAVFVHGLFSSPRAWADMRRLLEPDPVIAQDCELVPFGYRSPLASLHPGRSIASISHLSDSLRTFLESRVEGYERVSLVAHSQGGLVVLRYLDRMLADGRGHDLARIRRIVLFACPHNGSQFALTLRRRAWFWRHRQERELRPFDEQVLETQRRVLKKVVYAPAVQRDACPIPIRVYLGEFDKIVPPETGKGLFPEYDVLPGDHSSVIRPDSIDHGSYVALRRDLVAALQQPPPAKPASGPADMTGEHPELSRFGPFYLRVGPTADELVPIFVQAGPIDQVTDVDIVVAPANTYFSAEMHEPSVAGRLRHAAAVKNAGGGLVEDTVSEEIAAWLTKQGLRGLTVSPGTVLPTGSGALSAQGVQRIYHAAVAVPRPYTQEYEVPLNGISDAVRNVFALARIERRERELSLSSVCLPLLATGLEATDAVAGFTAMWDALRRELSSDSGWRVHLSTRTSAESNLVLRTLRGMSNS